MSRASPARPAGGRRSFGPVVLLGLLGTGLAAFGGSRAWAAVPDDGDGDAAGALAAGALSAGAGEMPLAGALALVGLACWGVLLVTRGRVRRGLAVLATLSAAGILVTVAVGATSVRDDVRESLAGLGVSDAGVGLTGSYWLSAVGALLALAAAVLAVRSVPTWPEMGRRYDAPGETSAGTVSAGPDADNLELWKSLDQGHDPTA